MVTARMRIVGNIDVPGPTGMDNYPIAMLITFDNPEDARQAMKDEQIKLEMF